MCGDDKLGIPLYQRIDDLKHCNLPRRGQCRLRFIEEIQPISVQSLVQKREKALAVGGFVQGALPIVGRDLRRRIHGIFIELFDVGRDVVKGLRAQKIAVPPSFAAPPT